MAQMGNLTYYTRTDPSTGADYPVESRQRVFISYRKKDSIAENLCCRLKDVILESVDCAVWYDSALTPGENYDSEIDTAIRACDVVVLLVTEHIFDSDYIWSKEIPWAIKYKKRVIPIDTTNNHQLRSGIEEHLGHIQFCPWSYSSENGNKLFSEYFSKVIRNYVTGANIQMRIEQSFAAGKHNLSRRYLTLEDKYLIGLGYLKGIGTEPNLSKAEKMLRAVIQYEESDAELEELKRDAVFQLKSYYSTQVIYALKENQQDLILEYQEHGEAFDLDILYDLGYELMSVLNSQYKKEFSQGTDAATGFKLLRIRIGYYFNKTSFHSDLPAPFIDWAARFSCYGLHIINTGNQDIQKTLILYFLSFCRSVLTILTHWDALLEKDELTQQIQAQRDEFVKPFLKYIKAPINFDLYELSRDPAQVKEDLLRAVVYLLRPLYSMSSEVCFELGHIFYDGKLTEACSQLGLALMDFGCLLDPSKRPEWRALVHNSYRKKRLLFPVKYTPQEDHFPDPPHQGELVIDDVHFYFIKVLQNTMYLMRDDCIIMKFDLWVGCGDVSSFQMQYLEETGSLEILNYELTHYDSDTSRYLIRIGDILEDELPCEEIGLPILKGRHRLPIY